MLSDSNLPSEFNAVKDSDEYIIWFGKPALIPFLFSGVPFLIFGLMWGAIDYFVFIRNMTGQEWFLYIFFALHLFPFWGSILNFVRLALVYDNTSYAATNKRLMMRSGF